MGHLGIVSFPPSLIKGFIIIIINVKDTYIYIGLPIIPLMLMAVVLITELKNIVFKQNAKFTRVKRNPTPIVKS